MFSEYDFMSNTNISNNTKLKNDNTKFSVASFESRNRSTISDRKNRFSMSSTKLFNSRHANQNNRKKKPLSNITSMDPIKFKASQATSDSTSFMSNLTQKQTTYRI